LQQHLSGLGAKRLLLAGMMTHMCVDTTVRAAADMGYACTLAYYACATRDLSFAGATVKAQDVQTAYLAGLNGLFAVLRSSDELCKEMTAKL
jgi:nicotinamidase-related amidase